MSLAPWKGQRVGNLRERVTFTGDAEIIGHNEFNEPIYGPPVELERWARVEPIKADERFSVEAEQVSAYQSMVFHTRNIAGIKATWQITWKGRNFNIIGWRNLDERNRYIAIEAKAVAA